MAADASSDDLARRFAAFLPLPPPPQKQQLSGVASAVLDAGGRLGRAVGDVFRRLRIDDSFYGDTPKIRGIAGAGSGATGSADGGQSKEGITGSDPIGPSGRFARPQGSMNLSATYDSRTNDVESSVVARGDLWRAEASHSSSARRGDGVPLFLIQLGPVLFVRDMTLLFPVHLSKRHLIWYGFERKNGVHSVCPAYWSAHRRWFFMSMICLNPFACSFMDMQFPNGQLRYVAGDGFTTRAFLPLCGGIFQAHGKFPGEKRLSFSFKVSYLMVKIYLHVCNRSFIAAYCYIFSTHKMISVASRTGVEAALFQWFSGQISLSHWGLYKHCPGRDVALCYNQHCRSGKSLEPLCSCHSLVQMTNVISLAVWDSCLVVDNLMHGPLAIISRLASRILLKWASKLINYHFVVMISICPTFGGSRPGLCMELTHSVNENAGVACGYSNTASPSAYASISIGRSKLNGSAASSGLVLRVDAPLHNFGRPWFSIQMNSGLEF